MERAGLTDRLTMPTERALEADESLLTQLKNCANENDRKLRAARNIKDLVHIQVSHVPASARHNDLNLGGESARGPLTGRYDMHLDAI